MTGKHPQTGGGAQTAATRVERRAISGLRPHPQAAEIPALPEGEFAALKADIAERGLQEPLQITDEGVLLDGHARLRALRELGHEQAPVTVQQPSNELAYMLRAALTRRHLNPSQRTVLAAKLADLEHLQAAAADRRNANLRQGPVRAPMPERDAQHETARGRTRDQIAALAGTSARTAQDIITVQQHQPELLEDVLRGTLTAKTAASKVRRRIRDANLPAAPPLPTGRFQLILADPPWTFGSPDSPFSPEQHYPTMSTADICALEVPAADNAILFLWACNALLLDALAVIEAWGFTYRNNLAWIKNGIGPGVWLRQRHELLLIATKGNISPPEPEDRVDSVIEAPRGEHSEKPEESYLRIERMYPHLSKLEMFARSGRPGWTSWGNEAPAPGDTT